MEEKAGKPKRPDDSLPLIESLITKNNTTKPSLKTNKQTGQLLYKTRYSAQNKLISRN